MPHTSLAPALNEVCALQYHEVLADRGQRHGERARQLTNRGFPSSQARDDCPSRGIGKGTEYGIER
jgi:hypothetical protein